MKTFKTHISEVKKATGNLKDACWTGYTAVGMKNKNGKKVPNCVPTKEETSWYPKKGFPKEGEYGYHPNAGLKPQESDKDSDMDKAYKAQNGIEARKLPNARILQVSNKIEKVKEEKDNREYDYEGDMAISQLKSVITNAKKLHDMLKPNTNLPEWVQSKITLAEDYIVTAANYMEGELSEEAEQIDERGADSKGYYRSTESGAGLTPKGAKHFGIKTAVTTPPSKLKPGSKAANRRKSFCARMSGMPGPMKDDKGRPTRKAASLKRWNCNE
jgi:hypothetical protein